MWRDLLHGWGYQSEIVAEYVHPELTGSVRRLDRAGRRLVTTGRVVLHYTVWSGAVESRDRSW